MLVKNGFTDAYLNVHFLFQELLPSTIWIKSVDQRRVYLSCNFDIGVRTFEWWHIASNSHKQHYDVQSETRLQSECGTCRTWTVHILHTEIIPKIIFGIIIKSIGNQENNITDWKTSTGLAYKINHQGNIQCWFFMHSRLCRLCVFSADYEI